MPKLLTPERCTLLGHSYLRVSGGKSASRFPPLIFIHGASAGAWFWENFLVAAGKAGFDAYALDLLGHGESKTPLDIGSVSIEDYVLDVKHFLGMLARRHSPALPVVFGHSMGGLVVQKVAETHSLRGIVLIAPAPPKGIHLREGSGSVISFSEKLSLGLAALCSQPILPSEELVCASFVHLRDKQRIKAMYKKFTPESGRVAREIALGNISVDAQKVRVPMLVVYGGKDSVIHPDVSREIGARYRATCCEFAHDGHMLIVEPGWEEVAQACFDWVKKKVSRTAR